MTEYLSAVVSRLAKYTAAMLCILTLLAQTLPARADAFNPSLIMDDTVFDNVNSMSAAQIDAWLNTFPNSCISTNKGFSAPDPTGYSPSGGYTYGGNVSAGKVLYDTAQAYDINPQVLIALLQREQSLITGGAGCSVLRYAAATGYGCPDSGIGTDYSYSGVDLYSINGVEVTSVTGTRVNSAAKVGFSQQLIHAAWLLKYSEQRSEGNVTWAIIRGSWNNSDDLASCYSGPMTQGTRKSCPNGQATYYDGYTTIDGGALYMSTGATAAFYWYAPHVSDNLNLYNPFVSWFGGTVSASYYACHNASNVSGAPIGESVVANRTSSGPAENLSLVIPNDTGSACIEDHTWANSSLQQWSQHIASNYPAVNPQTSKVISADLNGSGTDSLYLVEYTGTSSGEIEVHGWNSSLEQWTSHIATNRPAINPADAEVIAADPTGSGHDSLFLVQYRNTQSGYVEIHQWAPGLQQWAAHIKTNMPAIDPSDSRIIAADLNGDGRDEFMIVQYGNTASGKLEVHVWTPDLQQWAAHIAANMSTISNTTNNVIAADLNGDGRDELYLVEFSGTHSGSVEVHGWTPNLQQWASHVATSEGSFPGS